jgi:hypothetical protein
VPDPSTNCKKHVLHHAPALYNVDAGRNRRHGIRLNCTAMVQFSHPQSCDVSMPYNEILTFRGA